MPPIVQNIKLGETWQATASAFDSAANQPRDFVHPPQWAIDQPPVVALFDVSPDGKQAKIRGDTIGTATLTVTADTVTTEITVNVLPPYDTINVAFAKVS